MINLSEIIVTEVLNAVTVYSEKGRTDKTISRACYGLSFCNEGQITYIHNGKEYVSDPEHAVILPKNQSYLIKGDKTGIFPVINFNSSNLKCDSIKSVPVGNIDNIMGDFMRIKDLILFEKNRAKVISLFYNIIHNLSLWDISQCRILLPAIKYLESNYSSSHITNTALAKMCNISEVYFRKLFAEHYAITPRQYIIDIRISKAKQLLSDGIMKISYISEQCGFTNPYHFSRLFKDKTGLTPTEYMKQNRTMEI